MRLSSCFAFLGNAMPIYEYRCSACGSEKEYLQKLTDAHMKTCPACGQDTLSKLISAAGFHLKGSGWYATDFKGGSKAGEAKKSADGKSAEPAKSDSGTSETKTESTETKPAPATHGCGGGCSCA
jgi:putative FmdB family regulatory protein